MSENTYNCKFDQRSDCNVKGQSGHIELIIGPMFSGKTTELIRRLKRYRVAQYGCLIVKYAGDTRYTDNGVATHDRQTLPAISTKTLAPIFSDALTYDVIGIDEGQFFTDVVSFSDQLANEGKIVIVAALDGTFQKKAFGDILNLVPVAENVTKLSAICAICYQSAAFTRRKTKENEVEVIGGGDKYVAVCRTCFAAPIPGSPDRLPLRDFNTPVDSKKLVGKKTRRRISEGTWMSSLA
ncbi:thymidine kinase, cytosolic-like [Pomacea canaliculata]|uniref:thymidine kinase, cytosolic-like n=1 Tax=Pomacea canaliculata TaxID=400727 RepID=UPI000D7289C1|nr:thymidine kinase, cytosolic-like [Pomacea canaliculata]